MENIEAIVELLQPFAHYTNITSAALTTTMAMVLPVIKEATLHLDEVTLASVTVNVNCYNSGQ